MWSGVEIAIVCDLEHWILKMTLAVNYYLYFNEEDTNNLPAVSDIGITKVQVRSYLIKKNVTFGVILVPSSVYHKRSCYFTASAIIYTYFFWIFYTKYHIIHSSSLYL